MKKKNQWIHDKITEKLYWYIKITTFIRIYEMIKCVWLPGKMTYFVWIYDIIIDVWIYDKMYMVTWQKDNLYGHIFYTNVIIFNVSLEKFARYPYTFSFFFFCIIQFFVILSCIFVICIRSYLFLCAAIIVYRLCSMQWLFP